MLNTPASSAAVLRAAQAANSPATAACVLLPCLCAPHSWKVTRAQYDQIVSATKSFSDDSLQFMSKVLHRSGLGDETYAPPSECGAGMLTV